MYCSPVRAKLFKRAKCVDEGRAAAAVSSVLLLLALLVWHSGDAVVMFPFSRNGNDSV